jgi:hypothetical protein
MRYLDVSFGSTLFPKILGTYELEIHSHLARLCEHPFDLIVNIGAAEGYYAVGLARRLPFARVAAFECDAYARVCCRYLARINGVGRRVRVRGECDRTRLAQALNAGHKTWVISDCEGAEVDLLVPGEVTALRRAHLLVETHDHLRGGAAETLIERFQRTHEIHRVASRPRALSDAPPGLPLLEAELLAAMDEQRFPLEWLVMVPRHAS